MTMKLTLLASVLFAASVVHLTSGKRVSIFDNGLAQSQIIHRPNVTLKPRCKTSGKPLNLLIVLDSSGSLKEKFEGEQEIVNDIIKTVAPHPDYTRIALTQFSGYAKTEFNFNQFQSDSISQNQKRLTKHVNGLHFFQGITRIGGALEQAMTLLDEKEGWRPDVETIVLLVSDGRTREQPRDKAQLAGAALRAKGVKLYAYATGLWVSDDKLAEMTGDPNKVFAKSAKAKVARPYSEMLKTFSEWKGEEVCEEVPVCVPGSDKPVDLMFVMDGSQSVENAFRQQIEFLHETIKPINIHPEAVRVALVQYAGKPRSEFQFLDYQSAKRAEDALDRITQISGTTRTNAALELANEELKTDPGRRPGVPAVVVVLTDGHAKNAIDASAQKLLDSADYVYALSRNPAHQVDAQELFNIVKDWRNVYMNENITEFYHQLNSHFSFNCPGIDGAEGKKDFSPIKVGPVQVRCGRNKVSVEVRTKNAFQGALYAANHFDDSGCLTRGDGRSNKITLDLSSERCGIKRTPQPSGFKYSGSVVLQFHPDALTKIDQVFDIDCFHKDPEAQRKLGELNLKLPSECSYYLRKLSPVGCIALDSRVGEDIWHTWQCDADSTQYGFLTHSCEVEGDAGERVKLSDSQGCPLDGDLFDVPTYLNDGRAQMKQDVFRLPKSTHMRFKCKISVCDKATGDCDHVVPPQCGVIKTRAKRASKSNGGLPTFDVQTRWLASMDSDTQRSAQKMHYCNL